MSNTREIYEQIKVNPSAYFLNHNNKRCFKRHKDGSLTPTSLTLSVQTAPSEPQTHLTASA